MEHRRVRHNLCQQVVHDLGRRIVRGDFQPGAVLPQEAALCDELDVSRTVVREAVKVLAAMGLVETRPKRGTVVRPSRSWSYLDPEVLQWRTEFDADGTQLTRDRKGGRTGDWAWQQRRSQSNARPAVHVPRPVQLAAPLFAGNGVSDRVDPFRKEGDQSAVPRVVDRTLDD